MGFALQQSHDLPGVKRFGALLIPRLYFGTPESLDFGNALIQELVCALNTKQLPIPILQGGIYGD